MIYSLPNLKQQLDQGDLIDGVPLFEIKSWPSVGNSQDVRYQNLCIVLTQTCDFANDKTTNVNIAEVFNAQQLVDSGFFKPNDVKGSLRAGRIWGWYFLPADGELGLAEMIIDLRRIHTVRRDIVQQLATEGRRVGRLLSPYREHLAKHFADTFSRIGLPRPYETL